MKLFSLQITPESLLRCEALEQQFYNVQQQLDSALSDNKKLMEERESFIEFIDDMKNQQIQLEELVTKVILILKIKRFFHHFY